MAKTVFPGTSLLPDPKEPTTTFEPDGTSQHARMLSALDPSYARIDERSSEDLLDFVKAYASDLRFFGVNGEADEGARWDQFVTHADIESPQIAAYIADPTRFTTEDKQWLGRPHFALLLAFVELLRHARDQLNGFTRRHLDHYYRDVLAMQAEPPAADRANVIVKLRKGTRELLLPAGTPFAAGRDANNMARVYRSQHEIVVNRASVAALSSVYIDRRITGIPDVRKDRDLTAREAFLGTLRIALGSPRAGDAIPLFGNTTPIDAAFFTSLAPTTDRRGVLEFARERLFLEHYELRLLMRLVALRNAEAAREQDIRRRLAVPINYTTEVRVPGVNDLDDLYRAAQRQDSDGAALRELIKAKFGSVETFFSLMLAIREIDGDWAQITRLLEKIGRTRTGLLEWTLPAPRAGFEANLITALGGAPSWPPGATSIATYNTLLRAYETHLAMPVERLEELVAFFVRLGASANAEAFDWDDVDRILADASREKVFAERRRKIEAVRAGMTLDVRAFDAVVQSIVRDGTLEDLRPHLDATQFKLLADFRKALTDGTTTRSFDWSDADRLFDAAARSIEQFPDPIAEKIETHGICASPDATRATVGDDVWHTFGKPAVEGLVQAGGAAVGWALRSPLLSLSEGTRTITLTIGFAQGFDLRTFLGALEIADAGVRIGRPLLDALNKAFVFEISTAKDWVVVEPTITETKVAAGGRGQGYHNLIGRPSDDRDNPALRLGFVIDTVIGPLAAPTGSTLPWPEFRMRLKPQWGSGVQLIDTFSSLVMSAVHLTVSVEGLRALQLQQEDRRLDPKSPFEPFGRAPAVGARFYLDHPELSRARLERLQLKVTWMGKPGDLKNYYGAYSIKDSVSNTSMRATLVDNNVELELGEHKLFDDDDIQIAVATVIHRQRPSFDYQERPELVPGNDVRTARRFLRWELESDLGHAEYPTIKVDTDGTRPNPPYTPKLKQLTVNYSTSREIEVGADGEHQILHVHPFGSCAIDRESPTLLPSYPYAGELYIGVRDLQPPQHLTLLFQLAEGTSDPDVPRAPLEWSYLDGNRFVDLPTGGVVRDDTRGLINSGIVELALPDAAPSTGRLPGGRYWLRVAAPRFHDSVCDVVAIHAQAVSVRFEDRGNAQSHYDQPLPPRSITRLVQPDARIAAIEQPYSSFGGGPGEQLTDFDNRVSERLRHKQRALSPWDYERLVLHRFRGIYKAKCFAVGDGGVDVIVIPDVRKLWPRNTLSPKAPANLLADIQSYLTERAPSTASVRVRNAHYVPVQIRIAVRFRSGIDEGFARKRLNDDLVRFLSPWAYDDAAEIVIGQRIYANSILDFADRCDYVDYVAAIQLFRFDGGIPVLIDDVSHDYHVATTAPDQVLVSAPEHHFDIVSVAGLKQEIFKGIGYMRIEFDFKVD